MVELLVVVAILGVLLTLLLPVLSSVKERSRMTQCLSNLRQVGLGVKMYSDDHGGYPPATTTNAQGGMVKFSWGIGGASGTMFDTSYKSHLPAAEERPLFKYVQPGNVFQCPSDSGMPFPSKPMAPTLHAAAGSSYHYNMHAPGCFQEVSKGRGQPDKMIVLNEPPAAAWAGAPDHQAMFIQWHSRRGKTAVFESDPAKYKAHFLSPVSFFDGHVAKLDFTQTLLSNSGSSSPGPDWMWEEATPVK